MSRSILNLDRLESREVPSVARPAVLDLTRLGSQGVINGAIFAQYNARSAANAANGLVDSFLRMDDGGRERGYNTDARPLQFDESRDRSATHSIRVSDLPLVSIGGTAYRELVLDVNEPRRNSRISLDELQIFVSNNPKLHGYNDWNNTLGGKSVVWSMPSNRWVSLDAGLNNQIGTGDMVVAIPDSVFGANKDAFVALYSSFGGHQRANGASEQWGPGFAKDSAPATLKATISGYAYFDFSETNVPFPGDGPVNDLREVILTVDGTVYQTSLDADGHFSFGGISFTEGATYTLTINRMLGGPLTGTLTPGDINLTVGVMGD